jgi:DNA-nicking Smr family endonuclease
VPLKTVEKVLPSKPVNRIVRAKTTSVEIQTQTQTQQKIQLHDHDIEAQEADVFFARPGLQYRFLQKLRQGKMTVQATLDLHGLTVNEARDVVSRFLSQSLLQQLRVIKIIHGKGGDKGAILRGRVYQWLPQVSQVLAFCSTIAKDGGTGAVYVLLKTTLPKE